MTTIEESHRLAPETSARNAGFWTKMLSGIPEMLQLPLDFPRPKHQNLVYKEVPFSIDPALRDRLSSRNGSHGQSLSISLLTAFSVLLSRYSQQDDLVIGWAGPDSIPENILPVRFSLSAGITFREAVTMAETRMASGARNLPVRYGILAEELRLNKVMNVHPVFQVLFSYSEAPLSQSTPPAPVDISLMVGEGTEGITGIFGFNADLFRTESIERLAGHYLTILRAAAANELTPVGEIPLLTEEETQVILGEWNATQVSYPKDRCVHHLFEEQAARTPDAIAVEDDQSRFTYAELNEKANRLAHLLIRKGVKEGSVVTLFLERSVNILVGLLAISKSGGTYLPLDPIYPKARLELILDDAKPVLYLTQSSLLDKLPATVENSVFMDDERSFGDEPAVNTGLGNPLTPAYILYTSGSTGKPKGVQIKQHSLVNLVNSFSNMMKITPEDVYLSVATIAFDIAELDMYLPLFNGARVVIASQETAMDMDLLMTRFESCRATLFQATPVTYKMLLLNNWKGKNDLRVITGGDALTKDQGRALLGICKEVWNCYGPTETTIYSTGGRINTEDVVGEGIVNIGRALDNNYMYVLNPSRVPVPVGVPGELYIGGDSVSPGYLNLPGMTAEKFLKDPFSGDPDGTMYRSGDLVKYLPDGRLVFLNRIDSQVKIRGFRIELGEIETVLSRYKGMRENVVLVRKDAAGENMLAAYFTSEGNVAVSLQDLRIFLEERLPDYMVPAAFVQMERFPLTANNKIDKKALPDPESRHAAVSAAGSEPVSDTEKRMAGIWKSLLKLDGVGIHDDFFRIGGHSLVAVNLIIKIEKEFGIRLPLATLFDHSTIHKLSAKIDRGAGPLQWRSLVPIRPEGNKKPLFLIHGLGLNVLLYTTIVNHLDSDQPVYGLQAKGLNGTDEPLTTIEEIASYYIREIRTVDEEGPFAMAGFSLGGKIAFEMARQLSAMGKSISFLGLFDSTADESFDHLPPITRYLKKTERLFRYTAWNMGSFFMDQEESTLSWIRRKWLGLERKISGMDIKARNVAAVSKGKKTELPKYLRKVHRANLLAEKRYRIPVYEGSVHLFKAKRQTFYIEEPTSYGWNRKVQGGVIIHDIPGEHSSIFAPPNDRYFAHILQQHLNTGTN
jgi:amino acid adenylation domain-containing protein